MSEKKRHQQLENAPVVLAILEIRYNLPAEFEVNNLAKSNKALLEIFSITQKRVVGNISFENSAEGTRASINPVVDGFIYVSEDKKRNLTLSLNSFNFQQHGKYTTWDDFISSAKKSWHLFYKNIIGAQITGISIRYINKIEITELTDDPTEFFNTGLVFTSEAKPTNVGSYLIKYIDVIKEKGIHSIVTQSLEQGDGKVLPFMFDIDVHNNKSLDLFDESIWLLFEELRSIKNDIFFNNITEKTIQLLG